MAVTNLTTLTSAKTVLGLNTSDTSQDALLNLYIAEVSQVICDWCNRADFAAAQYTRVLSGNNAPSFAVPDVPIQGVALAGNTTSGSTAVTGLPTTGSPSWSNLFVNQSVTGPGIPDGTYIAALPSSGNVTLSATATATATGATLNFGVALYVDNNAFGGAVSGAFDVTTLQQEGLDYYLDYDNGPGGPCTSGLIYRNGFYWFKPDVWIGGLVTPQSGPQIKNIKIVYLGGYWTIPPSIEAAALQMLARIRLTRKWGQAPTSLSQGDMSVALPGPSGKLALGLITPEIAELLNIYVVTPVVGA